MLQLLPGLGRTGRLALSVSPVVMLAMPAGIGVTVVLQQLQALLGSKPASIASLPAIGAALLLHGADRVVR